jgi:hypothetical protein
MAGGFEAKTMRVPLSAVEVERPLVIGRGWLEFGIGADVKPATGQWTSDGDIESFDHASWLYTTERLDVRYGISRRGELYWNVPFHYVHLTNDQLKTDTSEFGLGDPRFGWRLEWLHKDAPTRSLITELEFKFPAGNESPGSYIGGPNTVTSFVQSTGTADTALSLRYKQQFGPAAVTAGAGYVYRFSGVTQYVVETKEQQFLGRFRPGSEVRVSVEPAVQLGPAYISAEALLRYRGETAVGTTSEGLFHDAHLKPIEGSDGLAFDVTPAVTLDVTRGVDVRAAVGIPVKGEDLLFFPLEDISPTYGLTYSGTVEFRY